MKEREPRKSLQKGKSETVGLFIGRFQPFHLGHLKAIKESAQKVDVLWIGIGSIDTQNKENPFTFRERVWMIRMVLGIEKISNYRIFGIKDYPDDQIWIEKIFARTGLIDIVFTGNDWTATCFTQEGQRVEMISLLEGISATKVREKLRTNMSYKEMVPECLEPWLKRQISRSKSF